MLEFLLNFIVPSLQLVSGVRSFGIVVVSLKVVSFNPQLSHVISKWSQVEAALQKIVLAAAISVKLRKWAWLSCCYPTDKLKDLLYKNSKASFILKLISIVVLGKTGQFSDLWWYFIERWNASLDSNNFSNEFIIEAWLLNKCIYILFVGIIGLFI